ncbi:MAG: hypothetical protein HQ570_04865 [Candidatus Omnitrophica bacterium]|nr:hypothetical protein [Candidatus Omnitrophota bacterium]
MNNNIKISLSLILTLALILTACSTKKMVVSNEEAEPVIETSAIEAYPENVKEPFLFYVYKDKRDKANHYAPSGWMGDASDVNLNDSWPENPYTGASCIKVSYRPGTLSGNRWVGMYWQNPPYNWGDKRGGFDLTAANKLSLWIRGEKGNEIINEIFLGGISGDYSDSSKVTIGPITLTKQWERVEVSLENQDLSNISGGFGWSASRDSNLKGCTFYLDEIMYE